MPAKKKNKNSETSAVRRVVAYARVSTEQQAVDGASLDAQQVQIEAYMKAFGYHLVAIEVDAGVSASTTDRPGLKAALGRLENGEADTLLVVKLDRLTRRLRDMVDLVDTYFKDRFTLLSVSESIDTRSAAGRMMLNMLTAVAEWEREAAAERTAAVMAHMKASGKFTGGWPPFGFKLGEDGTLIEDPAEQAVIADVRELKSFGHSLRDIAKRIPVNPSTGKPYSASQISRML
jgi:DNA invertase Pin-like site-specific DNA recombinase